MENEEVESGSFVKSVSRSENVKKRSTGEMEKVDKLGFFMY